MFNVVIYVVIPMILLVNIIRLYTTLVFNAKIMYQLKKIETPADKMSFSDCNEVIDVVAADVMNKHLLYYKIKQVSVIPDIEEDITKITTEIIEGFSNEQLSQFEHYYTREFLIKMITRKIQLVLVKYTDEHKPNVK